MFKDKFIVVKGHTVQALKDQSYGEVGLKKGGENTP